MQPMMLPLLQMKLSRLLVPCCCSSAAAAAEKTTLISSSQNLLITLLRFSTAATQNPPPKIPFMVEYLINSCGFSSDKAIKASKHLTHIKSPSNPDSVIHFLKQSGFSDAHIRNLISKQPNILCASAEKTLQPKLRALQEMGFSEPERIQLVSKCPSAIRVCNLRPKVEFWRALLGTNQNLFKAVSRDPYLLTSSLTETIMPNISLLRECRVPDDRIVKMILHDRRFITSSPSSIKAGVERTEELGVPRGSGMFLPVFCSVISLSRTAFDAKFKLLQSLGWSEAEVFSAIRKAAPFFRASRKKICDSVEFLLKEVGYPISYIAANPTLIMYSLERRLIPRHCVLRTLKQEGLLGREYNFYSIAVLPEDKFVKKFIQPHKEKVPGLHEAYVAACHGKLPSP